MEGKDRFEKLTDIFFTEPNNFTKEEFFLDLAIKEISNHYINSSKSIKNLFQKRKDCFNDGRTIMLENMFLEWNIEKTIRLKEKEKYKSILVWLMDNINDEENDFAGMIGRAVGLFGSILGCIKTEKTMNGNYKHKIMNYDWETEY